MTAPGDVLDTKQEIRSMIVDLAPVNKDFDENLDLYSDLGVPSRAAMELLIQLEERFEISLPDDDFIQATTLKGLTDLVERQRAEKA